MEYSEIMKLNYDEGRSWCLRNCNGVSDDEMAKLLGVPASRVRTLRKTFGVEKDNIGYTLVNGCRYDGTVKVKRYFPGSNVVVKKSYETGQIEEIDLKETSFKVEISGTATIPDIRKKLSGLQGFVSFPEETEFEFTLSLSQK